MRDGTRLRGIHREDLRATLEFLALAAPLLVLPDRDLFLGVNPRVVWFVVVFVAGLSFAGYLLAKVLDPSTAIGVTGALGGAVSPGMTVTSLVEQSRRYATFSAAYTVAAALAVTMLFPRNLVVVAIVSPPLASRLLAPFATMTALGLAVTALVRSRTGDGSPPATDLDTPFRVRSALAIGALVTAVLVVVNALDVSIPDSTTRIGIVLVTLLELTVYATIAWTAGERRMARVIGSVLGTSAVAGLAVLALL